MSFHAKDFAGSHCGCRYQQVYCRTGRRSADAVRKLESLGYTRLYDLGGILSWPYEIEGDFEGHF